MATPTPGDDLSRQCDDRNPVATADFAGPPSETAGELIRRLGPPPESVLAIWNRQFATLADRHRQDVDVTLADCPVRRDGSLAWPGPQQHPGPPHQPGLPQRSVVVDRRADPSYPGDTQATDPVIPEPVIPEPVITDPVIGATSRIGPDAADGPARKRPRRRPWPAALASLTIAAVVAWIALDRQPSPTGSPDRSAGADADAVVASGPTIAPASEPITDSGAEGLTADAAMVVPPIETLGADMAAAIPASARLSPSPVVDLSTSLTPPPILDRTDPFAAPTPPPRPDRPDDAASPADDDSDVDTADAILPRGVDIDPVVLSIDTPQQEVSWRLADQRRVTPTTRLELAIVSGDAFQADWVESLADQSPRKSRGVVMFTPATGQAAAASSAIGPPVIGPPVIGPPVIGPPAIGLRLDVRGGVSLSLRMRWAMRLDPASPWQPWTAVTLDQWASQLATHAIAMDQMLANLLIQIDQAATSTKRAELRQRRDQLKAEMARLVGVSGRVAELQSLAAGVSAARLTVRLHDGDTVLLRTVDPEP